MDEVTRPKAEWKKAADFAEFAEALGITTTQVFAVMPQAQVIVVAFSQTVDPEDPDMWTAGFRRDVDGILRQVVATTRHEGAFTAMAEGLEQHMREQFGEPGGAD